MTDFPPPVPSGTPYPGMVTPPDAKGSTKNNWQRIVGAVTGLLGMGPLGVIFGALGLQSVRSRTATNRGLALTGVIAGGIWIIVGIVGFVGVMARDWGAPSGSQFTAVEDVVVGDCFAKYGDAEKEGEGFDVSGLYVLDCDSRHYGEVYYIGTITASAYPGWDEVIALTGEGCNTDAAAQGVDLDKVAELGAFYIFPTTESWASGGQSYVCMLTSEAEDLVGSVLLTP
jgi:hypothetical protein